MRRHVCVLAALVSLASACPATSGSFDSGFFAPGPNGTVEVIIAWGGSVVIGGAFTEISGQPIGHVARRAIGNVWTQVGQDLPITSVKAFCVHAGALHMLASDHVWRLDGNQWQVVGEPVTGQALASYDGDLYCGGYRWQDGAWVDVLQTDGAVRGLDIVDGWLVAGGAFSNAAGVATGHVLAFDGELVHAGYPGQDTVIDAVTEFGGELYAARHSCTSGQSLVQVWRGGAWQDVPALGQDSFSRQVDAMSVSHGRLHLSSHRIIYFNPESRRTNVVSWDGQTAETICDARSVEWEIDAVLEDAGGQYLGGLFKGVGDPPCANLAYRTGGVWTPLYATGLGATGSVWCLRAGSAGLAVGGSFGSIGGLVTAHVAVYDGAAWHPRSGRYTDGLAWQQERLIGLFQAVDDPICTFGRWDTDHWVFGWGGDIWDIEAWAGHVLTIVTADDIVEIVADVVPISFASPTGGDVRDIAVVGDDLIAGGSFTGIEGIAARHIARYDGQVWQAIGDGVPSTVSCVGTWQGRPVVVYASRVISAWDGAGWQDFGTITGAGPSALQEFEGSLYLGGNFDEVDGLPIASVARWDGASWHAVADFDGDVYALAEFGGALWIGGWFQHVDGMPSVGIARYSAAVVVPDDAVPRPRLTLTTAPNPFNPRTTLRFALPAAAIVTLEMFDVAGHRVTHVLAGDLEAGVHELLWDGLDDHGRALPSGAYFVRLRAGGEETSARVALIR